MNKFKLMLLFVVVFSFLVGCDSRTLKMSSSSMEPTIKKDEKVTLDFSAYKVQKPKRWDIVAYDGPNDNLWIHRVVGLPGETVYLEMGSIFINGEKTDLPQSLINIQIVPKELIFIETTPGPYEIYTVPQNAYFLLGDNGKKSVDSRVEGSVPLEKIKAKVAF